MTILVRSKGMTATNSHPTRTELVCHDGLGLGQCEKPAQRVKATAIV
jgi:hypothetical protein